MKFHAKSTLAAAIPAKHSSITSKIRYILNLGAIPAAERSILSRVLKSRSIRIIAVPKSAIIPTMRSIRILKPGSKRSPLFMPWAIMPIFARSPPIAPPGIIMEQKYPLMVSESASCQESLIFTAFTRKYQRNAQKVISIYKISRAGMSHAKLKLRIFREKESKWVCIKKEIIKTAMAILIMNIPIFFINYPLLLFPEKFGTELFQLDNA